MAAVSIPIFIYFFANNALGELFNTYFYVNIFAYGESYPLFMKILMLMALPAKHALINPTVFSFIILGLFSFIFSKKYLPKLFMRLSLLACFVFLDITVFFRGSSYAYYSFIFAPFAILGFITVSNFFISIYKKKKKALKPEKISFSAAASIIFVFYFACTCILTPNAQAIKLKKEDYAQFQFAQIINKEPSPSLLCYNFMDDGFYYVANVLPAIKYYCLFNIPSEHIPEHYEARTQTIKNKQTKLVILKSGDVLNEGQFTLDHEWISEYYQYESRFTQCHERQNVTYLLYRVRP